jgi:pimeloyl-ACP methyl ester carboxylesterase
LTAGREKELLGWWFRHKAARQVAFTELEIEAYVREYAKPSRLTQSWAYYRAIPQTAETHRRLAERKLTMPVLTIGGSHSAGRNIERALAPSAPNLLGEVIAECGHFVPEEQPEKTAAVLFERLYRAGL